MIKQLKLKLPEKDVEEIRCPICNKIWMQYKNEEATRDKCKHLKFIWLNHGNSIECFNDFDEKKFRELCSKISEDDDDFFSDEKLLPQVNHPDIDDYYYFEYPIPQSSLAVFYGVKR